MVCLSDATLPPSSLSRAVPVLHIHLQAYTPAPPRKAHFPSVRLGQLWTDDPKQRSHQPCCMPISTSDIVLIEVFFLTPAVRKSQDATPTCSECRDQPWGDSPQPV